MKNKYIILVLLISLVLIVSLIYLNLNYDINGTIAFNDKKLDIYFTNVIIDYNTNTIVKIDNEKNILQVNIPNISDYKEEKQIKLDAKNISDIDTIINSVYINNIDTNLSKDDISIKLSLDKDDIIKKDEEKKLIITIKYTGKEVQGHYNFNINYLFDKVGL